MCPIIFEKYGVRTGEVFKFNNKSKEMVANAIITHAWNPVVEVMEVLPEPKVVVRTVANINAPSPVPTERIEVGLKYFRQAVVYVSLQNKK